MASPLLDISIVTYNSRHHLHALIGSIINQDFDLGSVYVALLR